MTVNDQLKVLTKLESFPKLYKPSAEFNDPDFQIPIYNRWNFLSTQTLWDDHRTYKLLNIYKLANYFDASCPYSR
jgi:hypothetical protein